MEHVGIRPTFGKQEQLKHSHIPQDTLLGALALDSPTFPKPVSLACYLRTAQQIQRPGRITYEEGQLHLNRMAPIFYLLVQIFPKGYIVYMVAWKRGVKNIITLQHKYYKGIGATLTVLVWQSFDFFYGFQKKVDSRFSNLCSSAFQKS